MLTALILRVLADLAVSLRGTLGALAVKRERMPAYRKSGGHQTVHVARASMNIKDLFADLATEVMVVAVGEFKSRILPRQFHHLERFITHE